MNPNAITTDDVRDRLEREDIDDVDPATIRQIVIAAQHMSQFETAVTPGKPIHIDPDEVSDDE